MPFVDWVHYDIRRKMGFTDWSVGLSDLHRYPEGSVKLIKHLHYQSTCSCNIYRKKSLTSILADTFRDFELSFELFYIFTLVLYRQPHTISSQKALRTFEYEQTFECRAKYLSTFFKFNLTYNFIKTNLLRCSFISCCLHVYKIQST